MLKKTKTKTKHTMSIGLSQNCNVLFARFITFKERDFSALLLPYYDTLCSSEML